MATVQASACFHPRSCLTAGATVLAISIAIGGCPPSPPATICRDDSDCPAGRCDPNGHYCYLDDVGRDGAIADVGADGDALASDGGLDAAFDATATDAACHRFGPVVQIAAAASATCVRNAIGEVKCWGGNAYGELGLGDTLKRGDSTVEMGCHLPTVDLGGHQATAIAAGFNHFCALLEDGSLRCWGKNRYGQLGLGDTMSRGAEPQHMGNALPAVPLGIDAGIAQIAAGGDHTCVLFDNRVIKCWGLNIHGQLGLGDTYNRGDGIYDGGCDAGGPDAAVDCEMGTRLSAARILADAGSGADAGATRILAGANHSCAVLVDGHIKCWGYNGNGLLGLGDTFSRADQSNELEEHLPNVQMEESQDLATRNLFSCALRDNSQVMCWGDNERGQLGVGDTLTRGSVPGDMAYLPAVELEPSGSATHVAVGDNHACAVLGGHGIKCWGWNYEGQLGQGDTIARGDQIGELGASLPPVALASDQEVYAITAGANHTCALLADGSVYCWGDNACGQLGLGDTEHRGDDPDEMGSRLPAVQIGEP